MWQSIKRKLAEVEHKKLEKFIMQNCTGNANQNVPLTVENK